MLSPVHAATTTSVNVVNQAQGNYTDSALMSGGLVSNTVTAVARPRSAALAFYMDSSYSRLSMAQASGSRLFLQADLVACNLDNTRIETVSLSVWSKASPKPVTVTATETTVDSGLFRVDTEMSTISSTASSTAQKNAGPTTSMTSTGALQFGVTRDDQVDATVVSSCGSGVTSRTLIDPRGIVFDAVTNQPVPNATVRLVDVTGNGNGGNAGGPATVFALDAVTPIAATFLTDSNGEYVFPYVPPSTYRLEVVPPGAYQWPSKVAPAQLPAERDVSSGGAYGGNFEVNGQTGAVTVDIPVDNLPHSLFVQKTASRTTVEIAESLMYSVVVKNAGDTSLSDVVLTDRLPVGFTYVRGSVRMDGASVAEPAGGVGPTLQWPIGAMAPQSSHTVTYYVKVGPGALQGDGVNRAFAAATAPASTVSNTAAAAVKLQAGVFTDKAMVLGTVFADCNQDGIQNPGEVGVPGIRLFLEDGTFVITDGMGRYSMYGIRPRTHVLKVDATTLPEGAVMEAFSQRHGGDGNSRFVDPKRGELHRADFAIAACTPSIMDAIKARKASMSGEQAMSALVKRELRTDAMTGVGDVRSLPSSGLVGDLMNGAQAAPGMSIVMPPASATAVGVQGAFGAPMQYGAMTASVPPTTTTPSSMPLMTAAITSPAPAQLPKLESELLALDAADNRLDVIYPQDGQVLRSAITSIRTKAPLAAQLVLEVNGRPVGDERVGERTRHDGNQVELREYVGVALVAGDNVISVTERDPFGNVRGKRSIHVTAPGELATVRIDVPSKAIEADGASMVPVRVALLDAKGTPVSGRRPVTLESSLGQWNVADLDLREPGIQTFVEDGSAVLTLRASATPGDAIVVVTSGQASAKGKINFVPSLRPMIAAGVIEGMFNLRNMDPRSMVQARRDDGFEEELRTFARSGNASAGARAAFFLKGKVKGDYLLTMGYDSDKDRGQTLFRDIQPDAFYPVYGDASVKGFDAQSTSRLYVRIDKNKSSLLYGDFTTQGQASIQSSSQSMSTAAGAFGASSFTNGSPVRQLGAYQRSLTGIKEHYETDRVTANVWASRASSRQVIVELPANGTSGPFTLTTGNILANSEKVEILVRDRNQPALVISTTAQVRFSDYDFEPLTGRLLMRAPVPSLDANLNPVSIRVSFEVDQGGQSFWVAGGDAQVRVHERIEIGGSAVRDWNPLAPTALQSVNASVKLAERDVLTVEAAHISHDGPVTDAITGEVKDGGAGRAQRVEWQHDGSDLKARAYAGRSDVGFDNQSSSLASGRSEAGLKASYAIDDKTRLVAQGIHTSAVNTIGRRDGLLAGVERSFEGGIKVEVGVRHVKATSAAAADGSTLTTDTNSVRAKVSSVVPGFPLASIYGEAEQDVTDSSQRMVAIGGDYRIAQRGRLYARHEFISSLTGPYALDSTQRRNSTVVGVDSDYMKDGRVFSEYRGRDAFTGRESEAAIGLRNLWTVAEGVRINTSFESVQPIGQAVAPTTGATFDATPTRSAAATAALEYTRDPLWKGTARLEVRNANTAASILSTFGIAYKLNEDWTALVKNVVVATDNKGVRANQLQERVQAGVAYRDSVHNRINGLARYEYKLERGVASDEGTRSVHSVSGHMDVQARRELVLTTEYAAKMVREVIQGVSAPSSAQLMAGRVTRDLGHKWDVGVAARVLTDGHFGARQYGFGAEVGYMIQTNMWLSAGYNVKGFSDRDLAADNYTSRGVYMRVRFKFDETLLAKGGL